MTIDDVDHYSSEEKSRIIASYPAHEREARTKGIPTLGSGRIFPIEEGLIAIEHRDISAHWPRLGAMDFGWDHQIRGPFGRSPLERTRLRLARARPGTREANDAARLYQLLSQVVYPDSNDPNMTVEAREHPRGRARRSSG